VTELSSLLQAVLVLAATALPMIAFVRLVAGPDGERAVDLFSARHELPWPSGVQEEDVVPWKFATASTAS
jgi:hypothetical protein